MTETPYSSDENEPVCDQCGQPLTDEERNYCLAQPERFHGRVLCREHQRRFSACAAMRWQPGR